MVSSPTSDEPAALPLVDTGRPSGTLLEMGRPGAMAFSLQLRCRSDWIAKHSLPKDSLDHTTRSQSYLSAVSILEERLRAPYLRAKTGIGSPTKEFRGLH